MEKIKIMIDCDPGIDDSFALLLPARHPDIEVLALSSCFGNNKIEQCTGNLLKLAELYGYQCPVYKGAHKSLLKPIPDFVDFHGSNGMGGVELPTNGRTTADEHAWDAIYRLAKENENFKLVTLGPMTNVAIALAKYEDLPKYLKEIIIMGGSTDVGNEKPFSEANIHSDPHAFKMVLNSGINLVMIGLNATQKTELDKNELDELFGNMPERIKPIGEMSEHYYAIYQKYGYSKLIIHDLAAMAVGLYPEIATITPHAISVDTSDGLMYGRTIVDLRPYSTNPKNVNVCMNIDKEKYKELIRDAIKRFC